MLTIPMGSPVESEAMRSCLEEYRAQLKLIGKRLHYLQMLDAITIFCNSFSIPKLQHILRTSLAFSYPLLWSWDHLMMAMFPGSPTSISFRMIWSWLQATLPIDAGDLGFRSASSLTPSAFLASADGASDLMHQLLHPQLSHIMPRTVPFLLGRVPCRWTQLSPPPRLGRSHRTSLWPSTSLTLF